MDNAISVEDVTAANRLFARVGPIPAGELTASEDVRAALGRVPNDDLDRLPETDWRNLQGPLAELFSAATRIRGVGLAVATKVLHLKRPRMIPILDAYAIQFLMAIDLGSIESKRELPRVGLEGMRKIRADIRENRIAFRDLEQALGDLPIPFTRVRLYDILCWSVEKWDVRGIKTAPFGVAGGAGSTGAPPGAPPGQSGAVRTLDNSVDQVIAIRTLDEFRAVVARAVGYVVITDSAGPTKIHSVACRELWEERFEQKVVQNHERNGRYFWTASRGAAGAFPGCVSCRVCHG